MPKARYRFNPDTLQYDRIELSLKKKIVRFLSYFSASIILGAIYMLMFTFFFDSPEERKLKREVSELRSQYELMNKQLDKVSTVLEDLEQRDDNLYRTIFEAEPISKSIRKAGFGGVNRYTELEGYDNSDIVIQTARKLDQLTREIYIQSKSYDELIKLATNKEKMLASIPAIQPISNKDLRRTASGWGWRIHPIYKIRKFHYGMDFTAPRGTPVYATGDGVVKTIRRSRRGYGNQILIDHGFGYVTQYAHLNAFNVKKGQHVHRGDVIGFVGSTGLSTAPHLHYGVLYNGKYINPINYYFNDLTADEYEKMVILSQNAGQSFD
ncbi:MAG: M23 family metallopeptidase [Chlorobi bacterium]|nr:M23 family metallopeptidase [Chlorobiota bacterium]